MKKIIYILTITLSVLFVGCTDEVEFSSDTEALGSFNVLYPKASATYSLNSGTPENKIEFKWAEAKPGVSKAPTYEVSLFLLDSETPFKTVIADGEGTLPMLNISFATLDQILAEAGFIISELSTIQWQVIATNGDVKVVSGKTTINISRFSTNGIANFNLLTPSNNKVIKADIYGSPNEEVSFTWQAATTTSGTGTVNYTVLFDKLDGDFSTPLESYPVNSNTYLKLTHEEIGAKFNSNPNIKWTVKAQIKDTNIFLMSNPQYVNWDVFIIDKLYLVGSLTNWSPGEAIPFNNIGSGVFELTVDLADNDAFKFIPTNTSWDGAWREDPNNPGALFNEPGGPNISGYAAGKYKIKVDFNTFTYSVIEITAPDNLYIIGSLTGWNPATAVPFNKIKDGVFSLAVQLADGDAFKFIPTNSSWDGAWKEDPSNPGTIIDEAGDPNISGYPAGKYVVIVDFNTLTFQLKSIDNLYIIGSLTGWNPATSFPMTEASLGVWSKVVDLVDGDGFKFIPTNSSWDGAWKEDPSNPGSIIDAAGDPNIGGYAAGKYVISVNFNTLSFSVAPVNAIPTNLYLVGSLTSWDPAQALQFNNTSNGVFTLVVNLTEGDAFKFIPTNTSWDGAWKEAPAYPGTITDEAGDPNISGYMTGTYLITVDFNKGNFSVVLQ